MGMYTELHLNCELKKDVSTEALNILQHMLDNAESIGELPDHPLFRTERWNWMLRSDSYYFQADTHSTLRWDDISNQYYLCIRCNLKNYDNEINLFVDWITPYIDAIDGDFLGFQRYENDDDPTLLYYPNDWRLVRGVRDSIFKP